MVANRIKGIMVEKLLKLDLGNTKLLVQCHQLLRQAVSEIKEELKTLKVTVDFDSAMRQVQRPPVSDLSV